MDFEHIVSLNPEDLLFYDIETFEKDSLVVFKNYDGQTVRFFWSKDDMEENGFEEVRDLIKGKTLVGYNNYHYDDKILTYMLRGVPQKGLKRKNDLIISDREGRGLKIDPDIHSLDCMQQIDVCKPSLKLIEGNMGKSIIESEIDFNYKQALNNEQKDIVLKYCEYDVLSTIRIFKLRKEKYFATKLQLVAMLGNPKAYKWNTTTISANLLLQDRLPEWKHLGIPADKWRNVPDLPEKAWDIWQNASPFNCTDDEEEDDENESEAAKKRKKTVKRKIFDMDFVFGFGGLHGVHHSRKHFKNIVLLDVGSMYPSIIIHLKALGEATEKYNQIRLERLAIKHKDKMKSDALKLILNSVYGNLKNQYSILYNPLAAITVCVYGQIALFDLCRRLHESGYVLVNANTDGIAFVDDGTEREKPYTVIQKEWEKEWSLSLEADYFSEWWQKDVNNYIAIDAKDGHIKVKGGEVNKYVCQPEKGIHKFFSNNNNRIVSIAIVEAIVNGQKPRITVRKNMSDPSLYQMTLRAGSKFNGAVGLKDDGTFIPLQKVNRFFACKPGTPYTEQLPKLKPYKLRPAESPNEPDTPINFPDIPQHNVLFNGDLDEDENFARMFTAVCDQDFYVQLIKKKLEGWGIDEEYIYKRNRA